VLDCPWWRLDGGLGVVSTVNESSDDDGSAGLDGMVPIIPAEDMDARYNGEHPRRENMRPRKPRDFGHLHDLQDTLSCPCMPTT
jgi:hypothetical protein